MIVFYKQIYTAVVPITTLKYQGKLVHICDTSNDLLIAHPHEWKNSLQVSDFLNYLFKKLINSFSTELSIIF